MSLFLFLVKFTIKENILIEIRKIYYNIIFIKIYY